MPPKAGWTRNYWSRTSSPSTRDTGLGGRFDLAVLDHRPGLIVFRVSGKDASQAFENESGGHRFQRIPPTEKRGRMQTSTITVAVLSEPSAQEVVVRPQDVEMTACRGSGAGGQHRNVTDSAVLLAHKPTGIRVRVESERSQHQNRELAYGLLRARLLQQKEEKDHQSRAKDRKAQVGVGMRGCKRRSIRCHQGVVEDHVTGKRVSWTKYQKGQIDLLY